MKYSTLYFIEAKIIYKTYDLLGKNNHTFLRCYAYVRNIFVWFICDSIMKYTLKYVCVLEEPTSFLCLHFMNNGSFILKFK